MIGAQHKRNAVRRTPGDKFDILENVPIGQSYLFYFRPHTALKSEEPWKILVEEVLYKVKPFETVISSSANLARALCAIR